MNSYYFIEKSVDFVCWDQWGDVQFDSESATLTHISLLKETFPNLYFRIIRVTKTVVYSGI